MKQITDVGVELTLAVVDAKVSAVNTDDVTNTADDWKIFEFVGIDYDCCVVVITWFTAL